MFRRAFGLTAAMLMAATAAFASPPTQTFTMGSPGSYVWRGVYAGPYQATLAGKGMTVYCVDYFHHIRSGDTFQGYVTFLTDNADLSRTRFGAQADALKKYRMAAYLTSLFTPQNRSSWGDIHATIWQLFAPSAPTPSSSYWLTMAQNNWAGFNYDNVFVITDANVSNPAWRGSTYQEYVTGPPTVVPEPASMTLVATGLAGLMGAARRRRRGNAS